MKTRILFFAISCVFSIAIFTTFSHSQDNNSSEAYEDICHVYVVDAEKALIVRELYLESEKPETDEKLLKLIKETEFEFPVFKTKFIEEELTTKHYPFPNSNLIITASVYYTDESLASYAPKGYISVNSITIGISVSKKREISSVGFPPTNSAITEVTYDRTTNKIQAKQYVKVRGRIYLVGLECDCAAKRKNREENK